MKIKLSLDAKIHIFFIVLFISFAIMLSYAIYIYMVGCQSCEMFGSDAKFGLNGVYFNERDYYCVLTKGRTAEEIASTDVHEKCHALISKEPEHFCGYVGED